MESRCETPERGRSRGRLITVAGASAVRISSKHPDLNTPRELVELIRELQSVAYHGAKWQALNVHRCASARARQTSRLTNPARLKRETSLDALTVGLVFSSVLIATRSGSQVVALSIDWPALSSRCPTTGYVPAGLAQHEPKTSLSCPRRSLSCPRRRHRGTLGRGERVAPSDGVSGHSEGPSFGRIKAEFKGNLPLDHLTRNS